MPIVLIACGVLLIAGVIALFMSGQTWRWYHITVVTFIMLLSLVWFYLASRTLKIQEAWRSEVVKYETALAGEEKEQNEIIYGGEDADGKTHLPLDQLKTDLEKLLQNRGRVWEKVTRRTITTDGKITALWEKPEPHGIEKGMILWVSDEADARVGGQMLGEFEVNDVRGQEMQLSPVMKLRPSELQRIAQRRNAPLVFHEIMPTDSREIYAEVLQLLRNRLPEDQREAASDARLISQVLPNTVPEEVKQQFIRDGKPPAAGDASDRVWRRVKALREFTVPKNAAEGAETQTIREGTELELDPQSAQAHIAAGDVEPLPEGDRVYVRPLRDYARLYRDLNLQVESLLRRIAEVNSQIATATEAKRKADADIAYRQKEKTALDSDLANFQGENTLMKNHVAGLETQVGKVGTELREMIQENRQLQSQLTMLVREAAQEFNRRRLPAQANGRGFQAAPPGG